MILLWCGKRPQCWWQYFTTKLWKTQWFEIKLDDLWTQAGGWYPPLQQNFGDCIVVLPPNNLYSFQATVWGAKRKQEPRCWEGAYTDVCDRAKCGRLCSRFATKQKKEPVALSHGRDKVCVYASSIAPTGHCAAQAPQSTQRSAAIS